MPPIAPLINLEPYHPTYHPTYPPSIGHVDTRITGASRRIDLSTILYVTQVTQVCFQAVNRPSCPGLILAGLGTPRKSALRPADGTAFSVASQNAARKAALRPEISIIR